MFPSTSSRGKVGLSGKQNQLLPLPFSVYCIKLRGALAVYFNSLPTKVTDLERHDPCIFFYKFLIMVQGLHILGTLRSSRSTDDRFSVEHVIQRLVEDFTTNRHQIGLQVYTRKSETAGLRKNNA